MSDKAALERLFECQLCGDCCKGYGGTYVSETDVAAISEFIGVDPAGFVERYCRMSGNRLLLAQGEDDYCGFCKEGVCGIHPVKPKMCRAWPFLKSILVDVGNWHAMARSCPGMRTDLDDDEIREGVRQAIAEREGEGA